MRAVFVASDNIFSPIGKTTEENVKQLTGGLSGIKKHHDHKISAEPFYASLFSHLHSTESASDNSGPTLFEQILISSIEDALLHTDIDCSSPNSALIIASTKGNIGLLENRIPDDKLIGRISLNHSAEWVARHFNFVNPPLVVSHACISGLLAIITGLRLLRSGIYENIVIAGADLISHFILSGFQSFQALSPEPCKPFDAKRRGITLGEGAATLILSTNKKKSKERIKVLGGAVNNDANHISGPSRTGEELCMAMKKAISEAGLSTQDIDFISAHGTATLYNDEMEARAISLAELESVPVNSLKGYYGHTLGAAGLIESIISIHSLLEGFILPTMGFDEPGTSKVVNVCSKLQAGNFQTCLKTASGFGGCNAAIVLRRD
jgi:3-oxoacyl-[acyl-carrier-protein] synthase-1